MYEISIRKRRKRAILNAENQQVSKAVYTNNLYQMENLFKTGGIKREIIDHFIFYVESVEMLKLFLRFGGDMHKLGPPGFPHPITLLLFQSGGLGGEKITARVKLVKFLIKEGVDVNGAYSDGVTPFFYCAQYGHSKLCKMLVERGADPHVTRSTDGATALHMAAQNGNFDVCRYLVEDCGLDVNALTTDVFPKTPLYTAAGNGYMELCKYLLGKGAKVDKGTRPLIVAAQVFQV